MTDSLKIDNHLDTGYQTVKDEDATPNSSPLVLGVTRVGIGTNSPSSLIHAYSSDDLLATFQSSDTRAYVKVQDTSYNAYFGTESSKAFMGLLGSLHPYNLVVGSGRFGIGTTDPGNIMHLEFNDSTAVSAANISSDAISGIKIENDYGVDAGAVLHFKVGSRDAAIAAEVYGEDTYTDLIFYTKDQTSFAERMRIKNNRVGIGTDSPGNLLEVNGGGSGDGIRITDLDGGGSQEIGVNDDGDIIIYSSDKRLKQKVKTIDQALNKVNKMRGVSYEWKPKARMGKGQRYGLIAQEVKKIAPGLTSKTKQGMLTIRYNDLTGLLVEAIKEQQVKIKELENDIKKLKVRK